MQDAYALIFNLDWLTGFITETGAVVYAFNLQDESYNSSISAGIKDLKYGIEISDAYFLCDIEDAKEIEISIAIKNTGDYDIDALNISVFEQQISLDLEEPLYVGETGYFNLLYTAKFNQSVATTIQADAILGNKCVYSCSYELFYGYVDYELDVELLFGDIIFIEVVSSSLEKNTSNNRYMFISSDEYYTAHAEVENNPYKASIDDARCL